MPGDEVFAGTLNGTGALRVRVDRSASDTVVARIVAMVKEASETKARTQLFIEKVEQRYSIGMVAATLLLFAIPLLAGAAFQPTLLRAMTFMIVASPCAVVMATMPPLLASIANAGRHGVLVKSAVVTEQLGSTTIVGFDKTGTSPRAPLGSPRSGSCPARASTKARGRLWPPPPRTHPSTRWPSRSSPQRARPGCPWRLHTTSRPAPAAA
jgi:E1-E2 ATPase